MTTNYIKAVYTVWKCINCVILKHKVVAKKTFLSDLLHCSIEHNSCSHCSSRIKRFLTLHHPLHVANAGPQFLTIVLNDFNCSNNLSMLLSIDQLKACTDYRVLMKAERSKTRQRRVTIKTQIRQKKLAGHMLETSVLETAQVHLFPQFRCTKVILHQ